MSKELTITIDDEIYTGLIKLAGEQNTSQFIESVLHSYLTKNSSQKESIEYEVTLPENDGKKRVYLRSPRLKNPSDLENLKIIKEN